MANAYLLNWNPDRWDDNSFDEAIREVKANGSTVLRWSTGKRKSIPPGSQVFLVRLGKEPKGLVGEGTTIGEVFRTKLAHRDKDGYAVNVRWSRLSRAPQVSMDQLATIASREFDWYQQASGVLVPPDIASKVVNISRHSTRIENYAGSFKFPIGARVFGFRPDSWKENQKNFPAVVEACINNNCIRMGWGSKHNLSGWGDGLREQLRREGNSSQGLAMLQKFRSLEPGDYVVLPQGKFAVAGIGRVTQPYEWKPDDLQALREAWRPDHWWNGVCRVDWIPDSGGFMEAQQSWPNQTFFGPLESDQLRAIERSIGDPVGTVYQNDGASIERPAGAQFQWTSFYEAIANSLLDYRNERGALVEAIHSIAKRVGGINYLTDAYEDGTRGPIRDICPFTAFGIFNRYITDANRKAIARELAQFLHVQVPVPDAFDGVPLNDNRNSWFFGYEKDRGVEDIDALWEVFRLALTYEAEGNKSDEFVAAYDKALAVRNVNWNLTMGLFWARPWIFPTLDGNSRKYISETLNISIGDHNAEGYLHLRSSLLELFDLETSPVHSFPELSLEAWAGKQGKSDPPTANPREREPHLEFDQIGHLLSHTRTHSVLLYGPAGTGKTYAATQLADEYGGRVEQVQFHPAYSYEDFMEGLRPERSNDGQISYEVKDGVFKKFCTKARKNPDEKHLFIIDEINRGNVPKVMGELMYCLEYRGEKHAPNLPYSKLKNDKELKSDEAETFFIPDNVHILGTMNSSDRSVALLDVALRRRFSFVELRPEPELLENVWVGSEKRLDLSDLLRKLNQRILKWKGRHYLLGHSYFMPPNFKDRQTKSEWTVEAFKARWFHQILPLLEEYFADDLKALREVIGSGWEESDAPRDMDPFVPLQPHSLNDRRFIELLIALAGSQPAEGISGDDE